MAFMSTVMASSQRRKRRKRRRRRRSCTFVRDPHLAGRWGNSRQKTQYVPEAQIVQKRCKYLKEIAKVLVLGGTMHIYVHMYR
jgi:hypothetical protein